jgi:hypothetical protein
MISLLILQIQIPSYQNIMKLAPLFSLLLLLGQGLAQSNDLNSPSLRKAKVIGAFEKQGQDLTLSKAIQAAESVHTSVLNQNHQVARRLAAATWEPLGVDVGLDAAGDEAGFSVALSGDGNILAVGSPSSDGNGENSGHVRVLEWKNGVWTQLGGDIDGEAAFQDGFGYSLALSCNGKILAVGAILGNLSTGTSDPDRRGYVRVFKYNDNGSWIQLGGDIDGETSGDLSGYSVDLSDFGHILAVGATRAEGSVIPDSGHVRVFRYTAGAWIKLGDDIDGEAAFDDFGKSVALSPEGNVVAVGAYLNDGTVSDSNIGHVRVYKYTPNPNPALTGEWNQFGGDIDGDLDGELDDHSGISVDLSSEALSDGVIVAIGAEFGSDGRGRARVYQWDGTDWNQLGGDINGENMLDRFGWSVSLSTNGDVVAVGANRNNGNDGNDSNSGHTRVFQFDGSAWMPLGGEIDGEAVNSYSGHSVELSNTGDAVAIGAPGGGTGLARVYVLNVSKYDVGEILSVASI